MIPHIFIVLTEKQYLRSEDGPAVVSAAATRHGPLEASLVSCNRRRTCTTYFIVETAGDLITET